MYYDNSSVNIRCLKKIRMKENTENLKQLLYQKDISFQMPTTL